MSESIQLNTTKYLNNKTQQCYSFIKKRVRSMLGFKSYKTTTSILSGVETMHMIKKGQSDVKNQSARKQKELTHRVFELIA
ncbi:DDE domain protein [Bacillus clarus]|uniref:DDE domain protein n=1 Tax=Bacillus clarus TaxID=2338372 RepID=A0A090YVN8_9BACI|nr:DDE domain protein [Bacillus clarus]